MEFIDFFCIFLYMIASVLFIMGIKKLGKADSARKGNLMSSIGMGIAVLSVLISQDVFDGGVIAYVIIILAIIAGSVIGFIWAKKVEMTGMPQLVALFNGFGGLSSMLVAISQYCALSGGSDAVGTDAFTSLTLGLTILIGAVAFTGSLIAWGKLAGLKMFKKNISIPGKNFINAGITFVAVLGIIFYMIDPEGGLGVAGIIITTVASLVLGVTLVITIGGGDMPVIISFLNALSGLAAAFAGSYRQHGTYRIRLSRRRFRRHPYAHHVQGNEQELCISPLQDSQEEGICRYRRAQGAQGTVRRGCIPYPRGCKERRYRSGLRYGCCPGSACC